MCFPQNAVSLISIWTNSWRCRWCHFFFFFLEREQQQGGRYCRCTVSLFVCLSHQFQKLPDHFFGRLFSVLSNLARPEHASSTESS